MEASNIKPKEIHLALVISGAVSLGTYEAGALVKLIRAVRASSMPDYKGDKLIIDVIAGASAGAMTGAMVAYCLLTGAREEMLYEAWVNDIDVAKLENKYSKESILSSRQIEELTNKYLREPAKLPPEYFEKSNIQEHPIRLAISLTNLNGTNFKIPIHLPNNKTQVFNTVTYKDWKYYDLIPKTWQEGAWENIKKAACASGAFPVAFSPVKMKNKTKDKSFFYTDGGVLNNRPLGLAIDAAFDPKQLGKPENIDEPAMDLSIYERLFLLIQPDGGEINPSADKKEFTPAGIAFDSFINLPRHQSLYEDLKKLERINKHLEWNEKFLLDLETRIKNIDKSCFKEIEELLKEKSVEILGFKKENAPEMKKNIYSLEIQSELKNKESELIKYLRLYINLIGRLRGKKKVYVHIIRPTTEAGKEKDILAGEFLMHFGGFLSRELRNNDFVVGYENAEGWLSDMGWRVTSGGIKIYDFKEKKEIILEKDARVAEIVFRDLPYRSRLRAYFMGIKGIEVLFYNFSRKHPAFGKILNLFLGFFKLIAYLLASIGGGLWIVLAFVIFVIGLIHFSIYLNKAVVFIKNLF